MLVTLDLAFTVPLATWSIVETLVWGGGVNPWVSWADTHSGYSRVFQISRVVLDQDLVYVVGLEITRWAAVLCAFVFFGFFGFSDEAKKNYRLLAYTVTSRFGYSTSTESTAIFDSYADPSLHFAFEHALTRSLYSIIDPGTESKSDTTFPVFIIQKTESKRYSFDSYSDKYSTSSSVIYIVDKAPRVPESALDPALVKRPPVPDAPKSFYPDKAFDRV